MLNRRVLQDAVPEIEDVRPPGESVKDAFSGTVERRAAGNQRKRVEIALHRQRRRQFFRRPDGIDRLIEPKRRNVCLARISASFPPAPLGKPITGTSGCRCLRPATSRAVGAITHCSNCAGERLPAQLSNNCTASAPASI